MYATYRSCAEKQGRGPASSAPRQKGYPASNDFDQFDPQWAGDMDCCKTKGRSHCTTYCREAYTYSNAAGWHRMEMDGTRRVGWRANCTSSWAYGLDRSEGQAAPTDCAYFLCSTHRLRLLLVQHPPIALRKKCHTEGMAPKTALLQQI